MNTLIVNSSIKQTKKNEHGKLLARISLNKVAKLNRANLKLSENEYDANFNTSKVCSLCRDAEMNLKSTTTNGINFRIISS